MKKIIVKSFVFTLFSLFTLCANAQDRKEFEAAKFKLYDVSADPFKQIADAGMKARSEGKNIFVQIGGNWCIWCYRFNKFASSDVQIDSIIKKDYIVVHINYSKENKNMDFMKKMQYPNRFGFPVFMILDPDGNKLHIQDSGLLEGGTTPGYSKDNVFRFLELWSPKAFKEENYK
jgi:thioredoxin-related protein